MADVAAPPRYIPPKPATAPATPALAEVGRILLTWRRDPALKDQYEPADG